MVLGDKLAAELVEEEVPHAAGVEDKGDCEAEVCEVHESGREQSDVVLYVEVLSRCQGKEEYYSN